MNKKILTLLSLLVLASCQDNTLFFEESFIIDNINLIDPIEGLIPNQTVVIKGNKIIEIYNSKEINLSQKNNIYSGDEKYLIPGLWDAHIHFAFEKDLASSMPNLFLYYGITSLRDTGGPIEFVNQFKQNALKNPKSKSRVKIAGPLLDGKYNVYDGSDITHPVLSIKNIDESQLKKNIENLVDLKVDFLKAYEMLSPKQFKVLMDLSKKHNLKVTGHVPLSMDVISVSNLGLNSIEHFRNIELSMTNLDQELLKERLSLLKNKSSLSGAKLRSKLHNKQRMRSIYNLDSSKIKEVVSTLSKNNTWQIPTLILYKNFAYKNYKNQEYLRSLDILPETSKIAWKKRINKISLDQSKQMKDYTDWSKNMVKFMHENDIKFMAGTDTPIGFLVPGLSLHQEIQELNEAGLNTLEALQTATINPSIYFNLQDSLGRIKNNYVADLIILAKNPLEDIRNTKSILAVIKDGNYLDRNYLDSIVR